MTTGSNRIKHVVIVGGGSAGWLTAGVIAADHCAASDSGLQVTVIESPDVGPIGVGEGTWPTMRDTLRRIGVSESDFLRECDASFKQGSRFNGWRDGQDGDYYFHPFVLPHGYTETNLVAGWLQRHANVPFADLVSFQPHLCVQNKAPKQAATPEYAAVANYAYHLDAGKFGVFLRKHCTERLGVRLVLDHVVGIESHPNGDIAALQTRSQGPLAGDLFVDCTGLQSLLLGRHYQTPFVSQKHVLFNDSALALQVPYPDDNSPIASQTLSTAQSSGWIWDIGLPTRRGIGHVYSSAHISDDQAEAELRRYVERVAGPAGQANGGTAAQAHVRAGLSAALLAPQLRRHRTVGWLHRTARSLGAGAGRAVRHHAQRPDAGDARGNGHRRAAIQRFVHLSMGTCHRFSEAALRAEPTPDFRFLAR